MDSVVHFEIPVVRFSRAQKFYEKSFGWKMNPVPEMEYVIAATAETDKKRMIKKPGAINGGMMKRTNIIKNPVITINVKNIDAALKNIEKLGGKVVKGKVTVAEMGYAAYIKDTEGNIIGIWQNMSKGM